MSGPTLSSPAATKQYWNKKTNQMQTGVTVANGAITGTLKYVADGVADSGPLAGAGNFLAIKFTSSDWSAYDSVKVGLDPSQGTGLVELINDPDKDGVFKITDKDTQNFQVVVKKGSVESTFSYDLSGLVCETE